MSQEITSNVLRGQVIPVEAPQVTTQEAPVLSELEQRLQSVLTPEQNAGETQQLTVTTQAPPSEKTITEASQEPSKYSDEEQLKFREMFELQFGVAPEAFKEQVQSFTQERQQAQQLNELNTLKSEWGVDQGELSRRLELISQKLSTLPVETQKGLDNPEGIRLLWSSLANEVASKQPPRFESNTAPGTTSQRKGTFTRAEINAMDNATYQRNIQAIEYAYKNGLVIN